ncbi:hypothetical protein [Sorangium sp. So ce1099]|uniref:hypothetical protein n=1 Tax=Sorangium sp. So ce1099 TaxID=3133331 RepID=UPI003F60031A
MLADVVDRHDVGVSRRATTSISRWKSRAAAALANGPPGSILRATIRSAATCRARVYDAHAAGAEAVEDLVGAEAQ